MTSTTTSLEVSRLIPASREAVFEAWTVRDRMNWYCPEEMILVSATADVRVGGTFRASMQGQDGNVHTCYGTYQEIVPGERLAFTHQWEGERGGPVRTLVTVSFEEQGAGTNVTLVQKGFVDPEEAQGHEQGWESTLRNLEREFALADFKESSR